MLEMDIYLIKTDSSSQSGRWIAVRHFVVITTCNVTSGIAKGGREERSAPGGTCQGRHF